MFLINKFALADELCEKWFRSLNIVTPSGCESYCSVAKTDLSTFVCKSKCDELCKKLAPPSPSLSTLNPVMNKDEQNLSKKSPAKALQAYLLSYRAEEICSEFFLSSLTDDESDACRHLFWAYLMAQKIDLAFAKDVLNAHESDEFQFPESRTMDLKNNEFALDLFKKSPNLNESDLKTKFLQGIKNKKVFIIKPNQKNWKKQNEVV